jgi:hypothetical protein
LHFEAELIGADLRFGQFDPNAGINLRVRQADGSGGRNGALMGRRGGVLLGGNREEGGHQGKRCCEWSVSHRLSHK